jgi:glycerol-3-phosphate O-acyltransferase
VLVTYLAARSSALAYAVGEWARVWPLSFLIRSMGAYFIRRRSRGALYRKVLARYVQMATEGGVTQAMYPEGGLSLTGKMQAPKMGLLSYIVEGAAAGEGRDVVFVPVAINYDRVLEDKVLIAAHARGNRRFGAKMGVVARFIVNKLWERLRGKVKHFGSAAVAFGTPLSLAEFRAQSADTTDTTAATDADLRSSAAQVFGTTADVARLSKEVMQRIKTAIPVPVVPLLARVLCTTAQISHDDLLSQVRALNAQIPPANRLLTDAALPQEVHFAMEQLALRDVLSLKGDIWHLKPGQEDLIAFYANSIAHFFEGPNGNNAAPAKGIAAPAGS